MTNSESAPEGYSCYKVVINEKGQYSIWPVKLKSPVGWKELTIIGSKEECIKYIMDTWTDMRR